ncbi:MAG: hypothetical protein KDG58_21505, partial [Anaerolineae bacterium]|nr:hypothetical protein [Anaerolineae bacterium]
MRLQLGGGTNCIGLASGKLARCIPIERNRRRVRTANFKEHPQGTDEICYTAGALPVRPICPGDADVVEIGIDLQKRLPLSMIAQMSFVQL